MKILKSLPLILLILHFGNTNAQMKNFLDTPYIESRISIDTFLTPDIIKIEIVLQEKDTKNKVSVEELEKRMFIQLNEMDINLEKNLAISDLSSNFRFYALKKTDILKSKYYTLTLNTTTQVSELFQRMEKVNISNISIKELDISNKKIIEDILIQEAVNKSIQKATIALKVNNQKPGRILYLYVEDSTNSSDISNALQGKVAGVMIRGYSSVQKENEPIIEFEKIKISKSINSKLEII